MSGNDLDDKIIADVTVKKALALIASSIGDLRAEVANINERLRYLETLEELRTEAKTMGADKDA